VPPWDRDRKHRICCPAERVITSGGGPVSCCPAGSVSLGDKIVAGGGALGACCPEEQACGTGPNRTCCPTQREQMTTCCGGTCADLNNSARNCGACGVQCGSGEGCSKGVCVPVRG
jgi:hypothetical protein